MQEERLQLGEDKHEDGDDKSSPPLRTLVTCEGNQTPASDRSTDTSPSATTHEVLTPATCL